MKNVLENMILIQFLGVLLLVFLITVVTFFQRDVGPTFKVTTFYKSSKINTFFHVKKSVQKFRSFFLGKEPKTKLQELLICTHRSTYRSVTF